jgi:predicted nucleotidyltransferase component of viral defense system
MKEEIKNLPASIHAKLQNQAKKLGRPFQEYLYYYAIERFLYRLSKSSYRDSFILKGGLSFLGWGIPLRRPTRDIDLQGYATNSVENLVAIVREICLQEVTPDGMQFDPASVRGELIINKADYQGVGVSVCFYLGKSTFSLQMDVSFANVITPKEIKVDYPSLLGMPGFKLLSYPMETAIAEKFQAMVFLDSINDRMKDFYDVWLLSQQTEITGSTLVRAIRATFKTRKTALPMDIPTALTKSFVQNKQKVWEGFLRRSQLNLNDYPSLDGIITTLREFLLPVIQAAAGETPFKYTWKTGGPWEIDG